MKYCFAILSAMVAKSAFAHPSIVPHDHPHVLNALGGLDVLLLAALAAAVTRMVAEKFRRG
jgi:hypothetical protein